MEAGTQGQAPAQTQGPSASQEAGAEERYEGTIMPGKGLYANINAKRKRIAAGSGERMRKPGSKGAPTAAAFRQSAKTAKKK